MLPKEQRSEILVREQRSRSYSAIAASALVLLILAVVFRDAFLENQFAQAMLGLLLSTWAFRLYFVRRTDLSPARWLAGNSALLLLISLSWSILFFELATRHADSISSLGILLLLVTSLIGGATYSLSIYALDFFVFQIPLLMMLSAVFVVIADDVPSMVGGLVFFAGYFSYLVKQRKIYGSHWWEISRHNWEMQVLIDSFPGGIIVVSEDRGLRVNAFFKKALNLLDGDPGQVLKRLKETPEFSRRLEDFLRKAASFDEFEATLTTVEGPRAYQFLLVRADFGSHRADAIVVGLDVHLKKEAEKLIESQRAKLQFSAKMAAIGEMAGGMAHEINNPLAVIAARSEMLLALLNRENIAAKDKVSHQLDVITKTVDRIARIIKGLRAFARQAEADPMEKAPLAPIIEETIALASSWIESRNVRLLVEPVPVGLRILARPAQISQVLVNLLNNALDAVKEQEGGKEKPWIRVSVRSDARWVTILVEDSGKGIPSAIRDKVMQPFFTTKPIGSGTGLGLSISLGIVQAHKGELFFDFDAPCTRIVVRLPLACEPGISEESSRSDLGGK